MSFPLLIKVSLHVLEILFQFHKTFLEQEATISNTGKIMSLNIFGNLKNRLLAITQKTNLINL